MADLKAFAEQLVNLTVKEVNELAQILKLQLLLVPLLVQPPRLRRRLRSTLSSRQPVVRSSR